MGKAIDITGKKFNRLTAVVKDELNSTKARQVWWYLCDCGKLCKLIKSNVGYGSTKSCGCLLKEHTGNLNKTTGLSSHELYPTWWMMIARCYNEKNPSFKNYGGRGITVCDRWLNSFENFLEDMGERPEGTSLDRKDVNGNYQPVNCEWSNRSMQSFNTRINNITGVAGVSFNEKLGFWYSRISHQNKTYRSPNFKDFQTAKQWRLDMELKYFGKHKEILI